MLGAGVYLSRELTKVESYPIGVPEHNKAIIKLKVNIGRWISIDKQGHQYQRSWASKGYDSAWVPAKCGMVASGLEEWCVYDPKRMTSIKIVKPNLKTVSCHYIVNGFKMVASGKTWNISKKHMKKKNAFIDGSNVTIQKMDVIGMVKKNLGQFMN